MHTSPQHLRDYHRRQKFQARVQRHEQGDSGWMSSLGIGLLWLGVVLLAGSGGCTHRASNENISATGTSLVRAETYVKLGIEATKDQVKSWLESAALYIHSAQASNDKADADFAKLAKERDQVKAEYEQLYKSPGAKVERGVRAVLRWIKWIVIGWAVLGALGFGLRFIPQLKPVGDVLLVVWRGINSFVIGCIPHGTNAANLVSRISGGDASLPRPQPQ